MSIENYTAVDDNKFVCHNITVIDTQIIKNKIVGSGPWFDVALGATIDDTRDGTPAFDTLPCCMSTCTL